MKPTSLKKQLQWGLFLLLVPFFIALWAGASFSIHQLVEHYLTTRLDHDAQMLSRQLRWEGQRLRLNKQGVNPIFLTPHSGHYFVIEAPGQRLLSPSLAGYALWTPVQPRKNPYETPGPAMAPETGLTTVLVKMHTAQVEGLPVRIYTAEDHTPIQHYLRLFDILYALLALLMLAGAIWLGRRLLRQAFTPLEQLHDQLQAYEAGQADFRLPTPLPEEVRPLAEALTQTLNRLQAQLLCAREQQADLAHALKTPVHALFQQLNDPRIPSELKTQLETQINRLKTTLAHQLGQARMAGEKGVGERFRLPEDMTALQEALSTLYPHVHWQCQLDQGALPLEREDGYELLGNLLDNACKWAHSRVKITARHQAGQWCLVIEDDGPGVSEDKLAQLGQRGVRLDERKPGSGLGLSIARNLVNRYGSTLNFGRSALGGLKVTLTL